MKKMMVLNDKLNEINFETQDAMYQLTLADSLEEVNEIKDMFTLFLEKFAAFISGIAKEIKNQIINAMKKACNMFLNMYKARVAVFA